MALCKKKCHFLIRISVAGWQETLGLLPAGWQETKKTPASRLAGDTCTSLTLLHSEGPKLHRVLAVLSAKGLKADLLST